MQLTKREAIRIMQRLEVVCKESTHHIRGIFCVNGRRVLAVHCSNGKGDLPDKVPERFRRSLKLNAEEFERLRKGRMDRAEYISILRQKGVIR